MNTNITGALALIAGLVTALEAGAAVLSGPITNPANGHAYYLLEPASWTDSQAEAVTLGGNLVTINDAAENQFIIDNFIIAPDGGARDFDVWLGYNDIGVEGTFEWVSGETPTYTNKAPAFDFFNDGTLGDRDYVLMSRAFGETGQWYPWFDDNPQVRGVVEVVPEPSGMAVIGVGLLALSRRASRRM